MGKKIKCKNNNKSKRLDAGYYDKYRGWYDVQECGRCNDYCRWVGNSGSGGNPAKRTRKKKKGKGKSWWSCRLGNKKKSYINRNKWRNGFRYKKCIKEGAKSNLPLEGNKSKYGGGKKKYDKPFPSINKIRKEAKEIANNKGFKKLLKEQGIIIPTNINKLLDNVTINDLKDALTLFEPKEEKNMKGGGNSVNNEEEVCPICQEEIGTRRSCLTCLSESNTIPQAMWPYRCGHYNKHCMDCYYQLFSNSPTCPLCRAEMHPVDHARRRVGIFILPFMREGGWRPQTFDDWTDLFSYSMFAIIILGIALNRSDESLFSRGGIETPGILFDILIILLTLWGFYKAMMNQRREFDDDINDLMNGLYGGRKRRKKTRRKSIRINPKMRGVFTKKAKKKGMSVQRYANYVIKKYKGKKKTKKQLKLLRQAVFAKTAKKWKKRRGGGKKRKVKDELRNIWNRSQKKRKRDAITRGNKDMNTIQLMKAMNSPVKKKIKRNNEEIERGREEWIEKKLQDDFNKFIELFNKQFGQTTKADIISYDIQRRKSLKREQEHPNYKKYIQDYIKHGKDASTKMKFIKTFINIFNNKLNKRRLSEFYDGDPELERNFFENFDAMSRTPSGRWNKKDSIIHDGNLGRFSPIPMAGDPEKKVSLVMTKADDNYFFNRPGG